MKKLFLIVGLLVGFSLVGCKPNQGSESAPQVVKVADAAVRVPFIVAQRYFVKNTFGDKEAFPVIRSQAEFDDLFGMATVMGVDGKPTPIDFSKQYVIAVIQKITDKSASLEPVSLKQKDGAITFTYSYTEGAQQSFSIQPVLVIIVSNDYQGDVKVVQGSEG